MNRWALPVDVSTCTAESTEFRATTSSGGAGRGSQLKACTNGRLCSMEKFQKGCSQARLFSFFSAGVARNGA